MKMWYWGRKNMVCIAKTWFNGDVTNAGRTDEQGKIELLSLWMLRWAICYFNISDSKIPGVNVKIVLFRLSVVLNTSNAIIRANSYKTVLILIEFRDYPLSITASRESIWCVTRWRWRGERWRAGGGGGEGGEEGDRHRRRAQHGEGGKLPEGGARMIMVEKSFWWRAI